MRIVENDKFGEYHLGFAIKIRIALDRLATTPTGDLLYRLAYWNRYRITIQAGSERKKYYGGGRADPDPDPKQNGGGDGRGAIITIDPELKDSDIKVPDRNGKLLDQPVYLILGHELIHALHTTTNHFSDGPAVCRSSGAILREEEITIMLGHPSENDLRRENRLPLRYGDSGIDLRPDALRFPEEDQYP